MLSVKLWLQIEFKMKAKTIMSEHWVFGWNNSLCAHETGMMNSVRPKCGFIVKNWKICIDFTSLALFCRFINLNASLLYHVSENSIESSVRIGSVDSSLRKVVAVRNNNNNINFSLKNIFSSFLATSLPIPIEWVSFNYNSLPFFRDDTSHPKVSIINIE